MSRDPDSGAPLALLFAEGPPGLRLNRGARGIVLGLENDLAEAIADRVPEVEGVPADLAAQTTARMIIAAARSGALYAYFAQTRGQTPPPTADLISMTFAVIHDLGYERS